MIDGCPGAQTTVREQLGEDFSVVLDAVATADPDIVSEVQEATYGIAPGTARGPAPEINCTYYDLNYDDRRCPTTFGVVIVAQFQKLLGFARTFTYLQASPSIKRLFNESLEYQPALEQARRIETVSPATRQLFYQQIVRQLGEAPTFGAALVPCPLVAFPGPRCMPGCWAHARCTLSAAAHNSSSLMLFATAICN